METGLDLDRREELRKHPAPDITNKRRNRRSDEPIEDITEALWGTRVSPATVAFDDRRLEGSAGAISVS